MNLISLQFFYERQFKNALKSFFFSSVIKPMAKCDENGGRSGVFKVFEACKLSKRKKRKIALL